MRISVINTWLTNLVINHRKSPWPEHNRQTKKFGIISEFAESNDSKCVTQRVLSEVTVQLIQLIRDPLRRRFRRRRSCVFLGGFPPPVHSCHYFWQSVKWINLFHQSVSGAALPKGVRCILASPAKQSEVKCLVPDEITDKNLAKEEITDLSSSAVVGQWLVSVRCWTDKIIVFAGYSVDVVKGLNSVLL